MSDVLTGGDPDPGRDRGALYYVFASSENEDRGPSCYNVAWFGEWLAAFEAAQRMTDASLLWTARVKARITTGLGYGEWYEKLLSEARAEIGDHAWYEYPVRTYSADIISCGARANEELEALGTRLVVRSGVAG